MQIKIYFDEKPVYLCDEIDDELNGIMHHPDAVFIDELSTPAIRSLLHEIKKNVFHAGIIWNPDFEKLKKAFFKHFMVIEAAGGIVQNERKELLFIFRRGKWDLPKGKLEENEIIEECAQREVEEETGVQNLTLKKKIGETYHTYSDYGKHILKISHWFFFTCLSDQVFHPQTIEDITEVKWVKTGDLHQPLANTFENIKDILSRYCNKP